MKLSGKEYADFAKTHSPRSPVGKDLLRAFGVGGLICCAGQGLTDLYGLWISDGAKCSLLCSLTLVLLASLATALGIYDKLAKHAGAGTLVPITGFSNAVTAAAMEFRTEGLILGTAVKMFTIAGPVIVYGLAASGVYGVIYWIFG